MKPQSGAAHPSANTCTHCISIFPISSRGNNNASDLIFSIVFSGINSSGTRSILRLICKGITS